MENQIKIYKKHTKWFFIVHTLDIFFITFLCCVCVQYTHRIFVPYVTLNEQGITVRNLLATKTILWKDISGIQREAKTIEKRISGDRRSPRSIKHKKHVDFLVYTNKNATKPTLSINLLSLKIDEAEFMAFVKKYYPANRITEGDFYV